MYSLSLWSINYVIFVSCSAVNWFYMIVHHDCGGDLHLCLEKNLISFKMMFERKIERHLSMVDNSSPTRTSFERMSGRETPSRQLVSQWDECMFVNKVDHMWGQSMACMEVMPGPSHWQSNIFTTTAKRWVDGVAQSAFYFPSRWITSDSSRSSLPFYSCMRYYIHVMDWILIRYECVCVCMYVCMCRIAQHRTLNDLTYRPVFRLIPVAHVLAHLFILNCGTTISLSRHSFNIIVVWRWKSNHRQAYIKIK